MFRLCTIFFDYVRYALIASKCGHTNDPEVGKSIKYIMKHAYVGDWFVLHQLSKNVNTYFFREFVKELRIELKEKPKYSRGAKGKDSTLSRNNSKVKMVAMNHIPPTGASTLEIKKKGDK